MRIGILGGTFDPPHIGHLLAASDAAELLGLDRVLFIPAGAQPLKSGTAVSSAADRLEMTRRLVRDEVWFAVDRGGLSFTVDTLRALQERWHGTEPAVALFLLLGEDAAMTLPKWREPQEVFRLAKVVVLERGGGMPDRGAAGLPGEVTRLRSRRIDVSSTEIRERVKSGKSIRGFVPDGVCEYVAAAGLYR